MNHLNRLFHYLSPGKQPIKDTDPVRAYNLWSESYDTQPGNLMLVLDDEMFVGLLSEVSLKDKTVVDIGCGTGRHWNKISIRKPASLIGYDVSIGMLNKLKNKFPEARVHQMQHDSLPNLQNESCDVIISTLTIAHIENIEEALKEWYRVLKYDGDVIITDYHPDAFIKGGNRTFIHNGQTIAIKNHIHKIDDLFEMLIRVGFDLVSFNEKIIDISMRHFYEEKQALHVFDKFNNVPIIYGMHLKKKDATT